MKKREQWIGIPPNKCENCGKEIKDEFYDAKTKYGVWGYLCKDCFEIYGIGLGKGFGQHYVKQQETFIKKV